LDNLIDALDPERRAEKARWETLVERLRLVIGDAELTTVRRFLHHKFQLDSTAWRWPVVTYSLLIMCPPALRETAIAALEGNQSSGPCPWLDVWLMSLARLESRLPPDVQPECVEVLVQAHINATNSDRRNWWDVRTCNACGLLRPVSVQVCPHCPAGEQTAAKDGWRGLAESELSAFEWEASKANVVSHSGRHR
jgi:hypothetical protein